MTDKNFLRAVIAEINETHTTSTLTDGEWYRMLGALIRQATGGLPAAETAQLVIEEIWGSEHKTHNHKERPNGIE